MDNTSISAEASLKWSLPWQNIKMAMVSYLDVPDRIIYSEH